MNCLGTVKNQNCLFGLLQGEYIPLAPMFVTCLYSCLNVSSVTPSSLPSTHERTGLRKVATVLTVVSSIFVSLLSPSPNLWKQPPQHKEVRRYPVGLLNYFGLPSFDWKPKRFTWSTLCGGRSMYGCCVESRSSSASRFDMSVSTYYCTISRLRWLSDIPVTAEPCEWLDQRLDVVFQLLQLSSCGHRIP